jgi:hypothetical protein
MVDLLVGSIDSVEGPQAIAAGVVGDRQREPLERSLQASVDFRQRLLVLS